MADHEAWLQGVAGDWTEMQSKVSFPSRAQVLELSVQLSRSIPGHIIEFGVWKGYSTRVIRGELARSKRWDARQRRKKIFACDSFKGLPEGYENLRAGTFATPVPRLTGVRVVEGFFEESLTPELADEVGTVSLAHFDADLESATACALSWVTPLLTSGSLLLFDEFFGEDPAEFRAFQEWSDKTGTRTALLAVFGREPSGKGDMTDRRALFQVIGEEDLSKSPPLFPTRLRRKLLSTW